MLADGQEKAMSSARNSDEEASPLVFGLAEERLALYSYRDNRVIRVLCSCGLS